MHANGSPVKAEPAEEASVMQDFDIFMAEMESDTAFFSRKRKHSQTSVLDAELDTELEKAVNLETKVELLDNQIQFPTGDPLSVPSSSASPRTSPFESIEQSETSVSTEGNGENIEKITELKNESHAQPNLETVAVLKRSMASSSRLIGTFTALKSTYLKLCKEFNYLLGKFNENERIKIELIHENNELRRLLWETIKEKELDRKQYKAELAAKGKC